MFRFADPQYLWLLSLIPILVIIHIIYLIKRRNRLRKFGDTELVRMLTPKASKYRPTVKFLLTLIALVLIIIMLARPQTGATISKDKRQGIEVVIALDISNSMLAEDVKPSRLERSKMLIENLIDHFNNDRICFVVFAGDAFVQLPITSDYLSAKMFLQDTSPSLIEAQGTDIGEAINLSLQSFTKDEQYGKAVILITDGEDHEGDAEKMAEKAAKKGVKVFILGIGSSKGSPIPLGNGDFLKDNSGQVVMTALNEDMCRKVAEAGQGSYIHVDNTSMVENKLDKELKKLQKGEINGVIYKDFDEQFQVVAILCLIFLIIEVLVLEVKNKTLNKVDGFIKRIGWRS